MHRKVWLTIAAALLAASLFAGSSAASEAAKPKKGGTLRAMFATDVDFIDPSLAYYVHSWQIMGAVGANLLRFADKEGSAGSRVVPEVAAGFPKVSRNGRVYTFTIRKGFRFSNGRPVTAANFAYSINRALNPTMQSPAGPFMADIVGADRVLDGKARQASGIRVRGNTLTITLKQVAPDFLARVAMPFFQAIPTNMPIDAKGVDAPLHTAGPYYVSEWDRNRRLVIQRNRFYRGNRPANLDRIEYEANVNLDQQVLLIRRGQRDFGAEGIAPSAHADLAKEFGINKANGRYFVRQVPTTRYLGLNTTKGITSRTNVRKAINWAIDRQAMLAQYGFLAGKRHDQILPPGIPGFKDVNIYPLKFTQGNLNRAKRLAGNLNNQKALLLHGNRGASPLVAQIVKFNMSRLGIDLETQALASGPLAAKAGSRNENFQMVLIGWHADYPDPANFIDVLLNGNNIREENNNNFAYFNKRAYNNRIEAANKMAGAKRYQAFGQLDIDITRNEAPWAAFAVVNNRDFVSARVGCYQYHPTFSFNLAVACIK